VDVERAGRGELDDAPRQDVAVGDDDGHVRRQRLELGGELRAARLLRLQHRDPLFDGDALDGGGDERRSRAALRLVRLGDDADDVEALAEQGAERGSGELRCPPEENAHDVGEGYEPWADCKRVTSDE
jgi:hypothetical protein